LRRLELYGTKRLLLPELRSEMQNAGLCQSSGIKSEPS